MARILSSPWSVIRGSIAGTTYLSGPNHAIIARQRTSPVNPNSSKQNTLRSAFSSATLAWKDLTESERASWSYYAQQVTYQGPLGPYNITGRALFIATQSLARYLKALYTPTLTIETDVPSIPGRYSLDTVTDQALTAPGTGFNVDILNYGSQPIAYLLERSIGYSASRNFHRGPWVTAETQSGLLAAGVSGIGGWNDLVAGQKYFWRLKAVTGSAAGVPHAPIIQWEGSRIAAVNP